MNITKKYPLPWWVYDKTGNAKEDYTFEIRDAKGQRVLASSEWLQCDIDVLIYMVSLVNTGGRDLD